MRLLAALCLTLAGCCRPQATSAPQPTDPCAEACTNLRLLGCPEGSVEGEASCENVCRKAQGTGVRVDTDCIARARSVSEVHDCHVRCESTTRNARLGFSVSIPSGIDNHRIFLRIKNILGTGLPTG